MVLTLLYNKWTSKPLHGKQVLGHNWSIKHTKLEKYSKNSPFRVCVYVVKGGVAGFDTGNGEKLSSTQATPAKLSPWLLLSFSPLPVSKSKSRFVANLPLPRKCLHVGLRHPPARRHGDGRRLRAHYDKLYCMRRQDFSVFGDGITNPSQDGF